MNDFSPPPPSNDPDLKSFPRGPGPLVSVLLPTRGRPERLYRSVESLATRAVDLNCVEFLLKIDDDDEPTMRLVEEHFKNRVHLKILRGPRGSGYAQMHEWMNALAAAATGDWLLIWNDDALMQTKGWDWLVACAGLKRSAWHGVSEICLLVPRIVDQPKDCTALFFLRRAVVQMLGRLSAIPHCDTWVTRIMKSVDSLHKVDMIEVSHEQQRDDVFCAGDPVRASTAYTTHNKGATMAQLRDAIKLQEYIDEHRDDHLAHDAKLPYEVVSQFKITDEDTALFLREFDEPAPGAKILEVGAHDEPVANILARCGYDVTGVDLREYNPNDDVLGKDDQKPECNYRFVRGDFCDLPPEYVKEFWGSFDAVVSLSAIEHFGLGTYGEGKPHTCYDIVAMRRIWEFLKEGGVCYLTVPFCGRHVDVPPHWRVYDWNSLTQRLVQDFKLERAEVIAAAPFECGGKTFEARNPVTWEEAAAFSGDPPHITVLLKLRKVAVNRLSQDGR